MSKIKILPENLANQIAAGEVIERPASVVKEFVENAIDAGALNISIQIEGDGSRLIRVVDDGTGMQEDDVLLSLERHATSKLASSEELSFIRTLGFRGEAIPSIASVSKMTITSRPHDAELGSRAEIKFGKLLKAHDMGCPPGTVMEVRDLFGNMPARKKFLKSRKTELSHIDEVIKNYALAQPQLGFHCEMQGRTVLDVPAQDGSLERRVRQIICRDEGDDLVDLGSEEVESDIFVSGYLLAPENSTGVSGGLKIFVNGRAVKDRVIGHAVGEGLHNFLLKGRRAKGVVFVKLPPQDVDVNVHPTKQEVRFHRSNKVHDAVVFSVRKSMERFQKKMRHEIFGSVLARTEQEPLAEKQIPKGNFEDVGIRESPSEKPKKSSLYDQEPRLKKTVFAIKEPAPVLFQPKSQVSETVVDNIDTREEKSTSEKYTQEKAPEKIEIQSRPEEKEDATPLPEIGKMQYVGQLFNSYIVCETENGFVCIDQHAAQERLIFEELIKQHENSRIPSQSLLFPEIVELSPVDSLILEQHGEELNRLGLDIQEFGGSSFIIKGIPATLSHLGPGEVVAGILARFSDERRMGDATRLEHVLAGMACKASIKAGRRLLPEEVEALLNQMRQAGIFSHCPHGRPVVKSFSKDDVKKWFLRT